LNRISTAVEGVDPINFAPALVADYRLQGAPRTTVSDTAWSFFLTTLRDAGPQFPLKQAWLDVRDLKAVKRWDWPSWAAIFWRWDSLPEAQKLHARVGHGEAVKALGQPAMRDKTSILPLEWVSLDGRTKDFRAHSGDGKALRRTFRALVDCATNFVLDRELAESGNARSTVRLIKRTCQTCGIFDRLCPDNGSAFAGHLVAGGGVHKFRNSLKAAIHDLKLWPRGGRQVMEPEFRIERLFAAEQVAPFREAVAFVCIGFPKVVFAKVAGLRKFLAEQNPDLLPEFDAWLADLHRHVQSAAVAGDVIAVKIGPSDPVRITKKRLQ